MHCPFCAMDLHPNNVYRLHYKAWYQFRTAKIEGPASPFQSMDTVEDLVSGVTRFYELRNQWCHEVFMNDATSGVTRCSRMTQQVARQGFDE